jgi:HEAT repeat protein
MMRKQEYYLELLIRCFDEEVSPASYFSLECMGELARSGSEEIRIWLARALVNHEVSEDVVTMLYYLSQDLDPLVRCEAVDSLSAFPCHSSFNALCEALQDDDEMVRAYAAFGLAFVGKTYDPTKALRILTDAVEQEKSKYVLVDIFAGMYMLGRKEMLVNVIEAFGDPDYHIKCSVLRSLEETANGDDLPVIRRFIQGLDKECLPPAVVGPLLEVEKRLQEIENGPDSSLS